MSIEKCPANEFCNSKRGVSRYDSLMHMSISLGSVSSNPPEESEKNSEGHSCIESLELSSSIGVRGFFETAQLTLRKREYEPPTIERAQKWARLEPISIVPEFASAK